MSIQSLSTVQEQSLVVVHPQPNCPIDIKPPLGHCLPCADLDLANLSLLHQFSTSTYATITPYTSGVWQTFIPNMAFSSPPLLHSLLAMSALHLSFLKPTELRYRRIAADHYQKASVLHRQELLEGRAWREGGAALFATSALIAMYVFIDPSIHNIEELPAAVAWIPLMHGIKAVLRECCYETLKTGSLAPVFTVNRRIKSGKELSLADGTPLDLLTDLEFLYRTEPDTREATIYEKAVAALREVWSYDGVFIWPVTVSGEFIDLLRMKRPRALALVAVYYCAVFPLYDGVWWISATPKEDLEIIKRMIGPEDGMLTRMIGQAERLWMEL